MVFKWALYAKITNSCQSENMLTSRIYFSKHRKRILVDIVISMMDINFILIGLIELKNPASIKKCDVRQWFGIRKVVNFIKVYFELRFAALSTAPTRILIRFN